MYKKRLKVNLTFHYFFFWSYFLLYKDFQTTALPFHSLPFLLYPAAWSLSFENLLTRVIFIFLTHKMEIVISFWAYQGYHGKIKPSNYNIGYESTSNNSKDDKTVDDPLLYKILVTNSNSTTLVLNNRLLRFS